MRLSLFKNPDYFLITFLLADFRELQLAFSSASSVLSIHLSIDMVAGECLYPDDFLLVALQVVVSFALIVATQHVRFVFFPLRLSTS
jgi:hypothetical protein